MGYGQDPVFSQYHLNPALVNPAFTGNTYGAYIATQLRTQWLSHDQPFHTLGLSFSKQYNEASGIGVYLTSDRTANGSLFSNKLSAMYSIKVELDRKTYLKGGVELGYAYQYINWDKFIFYDNIDRRYGYTLPGGGVLPTRENIPTSNHLSYLDLGTGVTLYNPSYYVGISLGHLTQPRLDHIDEASGNDNTIPLFMSIQGGAQYYLNNSKTLKSYLSPSLMFALQGNSWQALMGSYFQYDAIKSGLFYRHTKNNSESIIGIIGMKYGIYNISYSFDYTISGLAIGSGGVHEIGFAIDFEEFRPKYNRYSDCFEIFR